MENEIKVIEEEFVVPADNEPDIEALFDKINGVEDKKETTQENQENTEDKRTPEEKIDSSRFAALSKKEKTIREQEKALQARLQEIEDRDKSVSDIRSKAKTSPLEALEELGLDLETIYNAALGKTKEAKEEPKKEIDPEIKAQLDELAKWKKEKELAEQMAEADVIIGGLKKDISDSITDKFKHCSTFKEEAVEVAIEVIKRNFEETQTVLTPEEVLPLVESYYEDEVKSQTERLKKLGILPEATKENSTKSEESTMDSDTGVKTLTTDHQTDTPKSGDRKLTEEERIERALRLL